MPNETVRELFDWLEKMESNMKAITHELEVAWEAINELQGIDPADAGKPVK